MAGASTVVNVRPGDGPVVHVVPREELDQLVVALVGPGDWTDLTTPRVRDVRPGLGAAGGPRVLGLGVHAELRAAVLWELGAGHPLGPLEPILLHHGQTSQLGSLTHRPAGREGSGIAVICQTYWCVHGTQEEPQVWRTLDLDKRPELVNLQSSLELKGINSIVVYIVYDG